MHREHDDFCLRGEDPNLFGRFDPIHHWHADVHQNQVGMKGQHFFDGFFAVCRLTANAEIRCDIQQAFNAAADDGVVINQQDSGRRSVVSGNNPRILCERHRREQYRVFRTFVGAFRANYAEIQSPLVQASFGAASGFAARAA
jgi:hypothetical protein